MLLTKSLRSFRFVLLAFALVGTTAPHGFAQNTSPFAASEAAGKINVSQTSWIGNTLSGKNEAYMVNYCDTIWVSPQKVIYTNTFWDEGGHEISSYQWSAAKKTWQFLGAGDFAHGSGGKAICGSDGVLWTGQMLTDEHTGAVRFGVTRRDLSKPNLPLLSWKIGGTGAGARFFPPALLPTSPVITPSSETGHDAISLWRQYSVRGLAATKSRLFVSVPGDAESLNTIQVFDISQPDTFTKIASWRVPNAAQIAYDAKRGELWVLQNAYPEAGNGEKGRYIIRCFDEKGTERKSRTVTIPAGTSPASLAWDEKNKRLLVADNGRAQQIRVWSASGSGKPVALAPLGEKGGVFAGTKMQGNLAALSGTRFFGPRAAAADESGNVYVSEGGPNALARLSVLTMEGKALRPPLLAAEGNMIADADPHNPSEVYSDTKHYHLNYQIAVPGKEATLVGVTANPVAFPQDPRFFIAYPNGAVGARTRRIQGKPFLFVKFDLGLGIYRFDQQRFGETAIPCGFVAEVDVSAKKWAVWTPPVHQWIWRDINGDGKWDKNEFALPPRYGEKNAPFIPNLSPVHNWEVDKKNTLVTVQQLSNQMVLYPLRGLDKWGSPIYDTGGTSEKIGLASPQTESALPAPFNDNGDRFRGLGNFGFPGGVISRLHYDAPSDTMFLCGYSITYPDTFAARIKAGHIPFSNPPVSGPPGKEAGWVKNEDYDGNPAGRLLSAYPRWSQGGRTAAWVQTLPYHSAPADNYFGADVPNSIASAGRFVFVGYRYTQRILVYDAQTGALQPQYLSPNANIVGDNSGALDIWQAISATFLPPDKALSRPNGEYVVWAESNTRNRILMHRWKPKTP